MITKILVLFLIILLIAICNDMEKEDEKNHVETEEERVMRLIIEDRRAQGI